MDQHEDESARGSGGLIAGIVIGALIGAGIALLAAPNTGEDTRRQISRRARGLRDDAAERFDDLSVRARRELKRRRRQLRDRLEDGVDSVRERSAERD
jgi:gas vesicle protein